MSKSEDRLPEDLRGVMFLMHYRYGRGRRIVLGCEKWVEDTYDRLVQLGLLAKTTQSGSRGKVYATYKLAM